MENQPMHAQFLPTHLATLLAVTLGLSCVAGEAHSASNLSSFIQNATGACQAALPAFDAQIRKRPVAIVNEGTAPAFVSCSLMGTDRSVDGITAIEVLAENQTGAPIDLTCTLVAGLSTAGAPHVLPQTITTPGDIEFLWGPADNGGVPFNDPTINLTCQLPVGVGLSTINVVFLVDVSA